MTHDIHLHHIGTVPGSLRIEERGLRQIVLEVGGGRFGGFKPHTSSLAPQTIPLQPQTSNKTRRGTHVSGSGTVPLKKDQS
jgi:hypothetical protein